MKKSLTIVQIMFFCEHFKNISKIWKLWMNIL